MIDNDKKEIEISKISMNEFIRNYRGMVSDYLPEMCSARYMLNYGDVNYLVVSLKNVKVNESLDNNMFEVNDYEKKNIT